MVPEYKTQAQEAVRLVIWDLDETFWKGTFSEGGITAYVQLHHNIVIELARRGIISTICSKNNPEHILPLLRTTGILDYFVFPDISWEPKGPRLAQLVDRVQLRAESVLFIDDNPSNRAEARAVVPNLQVEDETFISKMLDDPRFEGKADNEFTRLAQYKLLARRQVDLDRFENKNDEFLRSCEIRVTIEYDIASNIGRAVELINRTNQLNFTKNRLPENETQATEVLSSLLMSSETQRAGLVRVCDKYGDYGLVGFFLIRSGQVDPVLGQQPAFLHHYCFSCRILGMAVESWLYDYLMCPLIEIAEPILTNLNQRCEIDWIHMVPTLQNGIVPATHLAAEIRVHGGCEASSVAHYLSACCKKLAVSGNFASGVHFIRLNSAPLLLSACSRKGPDFEQEAAALGIPYEHLVNSYFDEIPEGTIFVFSGQADCPGPHRYRHKIHGWDIKVEPNGFLQSMDAVKISNEEFQQLIEELSPNPILQGEVHHLARHLRENYESVPYPSDEDLELYMTRIFDCIPVGSKFIHILDDDRMRWTDGIIRAAPWNTHYANQIRAIAKDYAFVSVLSFTDCISHESEILVGGNHYDRMVFWRMAEAIIAALNTLPEKGLTTAAQALPNEKDDHKIEVFF